MSGAKRPTRASHSVFDAEGFPVGPAVIDIDDGPVVGKGPKPPETEAQRILRVAAAEDMAVVDHSPVARPPVVSPLTTEDDRWSRPPEGKCEPYDLG